MLQDLETVAPSAIVCVAFLVAVVALLRREMAPKRKARRRSGPERTDHAARQDRGQNEL